MQERQLSAKPVIVPSVAVLPVLNLSGNKQEEYVADGMTDQLTGDLAQNSGLRVVSRTSVMQFKNADRPLPEIATALHADTVVESSLMRDGGHVRMIVHLEDARSDRHLWARTYDQGSDDIYSLAAQVSRDLNAQIAGKAAGATDAHRQDHIPNPQAYDLYLQGRYFSQKHTPEALRRTIQLYQQTIAADPEYAQAYASLAGNLIDSIRYALLPQGEALSRSEAAALKAVALDASLAGAHSTMGLVKEYAHWDWAGAEAEFRLAISLNNEARFHANLGSLLSHVGRREEALREGELAVRMEPTSLAINTQLAESLYLARDYDGAIRQARNTLAMEPSFYEATETLAKALHQQGRDLQAIDVMKHGATPILPMSFPQTLMAVLYASAHQNGRVETVLLAKQKSRFPYAKAPYDLALIEASTGDIAEADRQMELAYAEHDIRLVLIKTDPLCDPLRKDRAFQDIQKMLKFP